jgi:hypothetical protein
MNRERLTTKAERVLLMATYLTRPVFNWFKPFIRDYQEHEEDNQAPETNKIFTSYNVFKKQLEDTFSDINKERNAERQLWRLKQIGSIREYISKFQQIISHLSWDEDMNII